VIDRKEYFKEYYQNNKPTPEMKKLLLEANREKRAEQNKAYREKFREEHKAKLGRPPKKEEIIL
jgi:hypothetical protein